MKYTDKPDGLKIAILIPCYNVGAFLPALFDDINAQTVPFDEIICYDDYSADNTAIVAAQLGAKVISGARNYGAAFARNRLIEATACNWIHFHDADDRIDPLFVETMKSYLENENIQLLCNTIVVYDAETPRNDDVISYSDLSGTDDQIAYFLNKVGFASMGLYSRFALNKINGFNENLRGNEDPDLHVRLAAAGFRIKSVDRFLVQKIEHEKSFSHQNWFRCLQDKLTCLELYSSTLQKEYWKTLGKQAAELSNYFYRENDPELSKRARYFACKMGTKNIDSSLFAKVVSSVFGLKFYLWSYRVRIDIKRKWSKKLHNITV